MNKPASSSEQLFSHVFSVAAGADSKRPDEIDTDDDDDDAAVGEDGGEPWWHETGPIAPHLVGLKLAVLSFEHDL